MGKTMQEHAFPALHTFERVISTCLSVCEVVLAEPLPQQPVLSEGPQIRTHLAQAD